MQDSAITCNVQNLSAQAEAQVVLVFIPDTCMLISCDALCTYRLDRSTDQAENISERYSVKIIPFQKDRKKIRPLSFLIR